MCVCDIKQGINPDDGTVIAVKKLQENAPMPAGKIFINEVQNIMVLKHANIVKMVGYCSETTKKLVQFDHRYIQADVTESVLCYEYLPKGDLAKNLFGMYNIICHILHSLLVSFSGNIFGFGVTASL